MGQSITEKTAKIKCNLAKLIINDSQNFVVEKKKKKSGGVNGAFLGPWIAQRNRRQNYKERKI